MILITGAAGNLGRLVIEQLLETVPAGEIVAAVRRPDAVQDLADRGVDVRIADYERPEQWPATLERVQKVLLIATSDVTQRLTHHSTVVDAAAAAGSVELLAYTSMFHADSSTYLHAESDRLIEASIRAADIRHVFLRHNWFIENYTDPAPYAAADGTLYGAAGQGRIFAAGRTDYASAAARVLTTGDSLPEAYELAGDHGFTLTELAAEIARQSGKPVEYCNVDEATLASHLLATGYPRPIAETLANADAVAARGELVDDDHELSALIGRPTTTLAQAVADALRRAG